MIKSLFILAILAVASFIVSLSAGSVNLSPTEVFSILLGADAPDTHRLIMELRLTRAMTAFLVGALLSVAGVLMQVILRNPLADPYILGISGGASVAALIAITLGITGIWFSLSAFCGALLSILIVFGLARGGGSWTPTRVLLTGVVLASGWGALISFILATSTDQNLRGMLFWLMGDLTYARSFGWPALVLAAGFALAFWQARPMNLLMHGTLQASALGVSVNQLHILIFFIASLLTASAVSIAGSIGFLGLIVPHLIRLSITSDHRILLPASVLLGGSLLVFADTLARTLISPQQLPVGVITALLGVPLFLAILHQGKRLQQ